MRISQGALPESIKSTVAAIKDYMLWYLCHNMGVWSVLKVNFYFQVLEPLKWFLKYSCKD